MVPISGVCGALPGVTRPRWSSGMLAARALRVAAHRGARTVTATGSRPSGFAADSGWRLAGCAGRAALAGARRGRRGISTDHFISRAVRFPRAAETTAVVAGGRRYTYGELDRDSSALAASLLDAAGVADLAEQRVAFLCPPSYEYAVMQWGVWRAGGICVPLCVQHPAAELQYAIQDSDASVVLAHPDMLGRVQDAAADGERRAIVVPPIGTALPLPQALTLPEFGLDRRAMIIYTSGTTGPPKGVVSTHATIQAQSSDLIAAWEWTAEDVIYNVLPLHHVHGVINVLTCALASGACCELPPKFSPAHTWQRFLDGGLTLFMAVPTVYVKLVDHWEAQPPEERARLTASLKALRLMVCGSAALPQPVMEKWREVSGHVLLERYGMTEIGMALSNSYRGQRLPGHVGRPLPSVGLKIVSGDGVVLTHPSGQETPDSPRSIAGDLRVKGATVFKEYWGKPEATAKEFDEDLFFLTGDVVEYHVETNSYQILGRSSVDIIKTGGYKLSALDIERELLSHPNVAECAVVGLPDDRWGERVAAVVVARAGSIDLESVRDFLGPRMAPYKIPTVLKVQDEIPRNQMGKINKKQLRKDVFPDH